MTSLAVTLTDPAALTLDVADYRTTVEAGALVVDIRSRVQRERQGVLAGAVAVEARSRRRAARSPFGGTPRRRGRGARGAPRQ